MTPLADTHCHLDLPAFAADLPQVVERARQAGLGVLLNPGADLDSSRRAVALSRADELFRAGVGMHPHEAAAWRHTAGELAELARAPEVVAIGEIGLDYHYDLAPRELQREALAGQLSLARRLNLPVLLHHRDAAADFLAILRREGLPAAGGVVHAFTGDLAFAGALLDLGLHLGLGGMLTFPRAQELREVARWIPLDRTLLETDAPYLTPVPLRGRRNEPAFITFVRDRLATLRGISPEETASRTTSNAARLFRLPHLL
ncbi:MAG: TatD family hydrolase [Thermaerobacter sp.]|nr:TatD family hydrolase [Thermaerobacter sp.]